MTGCGQCATHESKRLTGRCRARRESHIGILSLVATAVLRIVMVQVLGHVACLEARLLHHQVAHRVQVAMTAGQVTVVCVLVARGGHFLLGRHHRAAFTAIIMLG